MLLRILVSIILFLGFLSWSDPAQGQRWNVWSTTPVFDEGRCKPLSSFARQVVKEICGTESPLIVMDDTILVELGHVLEKAGKSQQESESAFSLPPRQDLAIGQLDLGLGVAAVQQTERPGDATLKIRNLDPRQAERIIQRINTLAPAQGRRYSAVELLFSWFAEPEVWDYIPLFYVAESDYRAEVLHLNYRNDNRTRLKRVSVFQLKQSGPFHSRLTDIDRKMRLGTGGEGLSRYDQITRRIAKCLNCYEELTFSPKRHYPDRMVRLLQDAAGTGENSTYSHAFQAWNYLYQMGAADAAVSEPISTEPISTEPLRGTGSRLTMDRWQAISRMMILLAGAFDRHDSLGEPLVPNLNAVEEQFELLLEHIDINLRESSALMERCYPGIVFQESFDEGQPLPNVEQFLPNLFKDEYFKRNQEVIRRTSLAYHYSVKKLRREVEAAYISLYDNGRTLRVFPVLSEQFREETGDAALIQPWATMTMLLHGGDAAVKRFLDPAFQKWKQTETQPAEETAVTIPVLEDDLPVIPGILSTDLNESMIKGNERPGKQDRENEADGQENTDAKINEPWELDLFAPEKPVEQYHSSSQRIVPSDAVRWIRVYFDRLYSTYQSPGREDVIEQFNETVTNMQQSLRDAAGRNESRLFKMIDEDNLAEKGRFDKIAYPARGAMHAEYRYFKLAPFFWMGLFAALAIFFTVISFLIGLFRREMIDTPTVGMTSGIHLESEEHQQAPEEEYPMELEDSPMTLQADYTRSPEEYFLFAGIAMLGLSILITLIGGFQRAWITGWAPVTNMYETVVLLAFSASLFGMWYVLYPWIHPALSMAWKFSAFPSVRNLFFAPKSTVVSLSGSEHAGMASSASAQFQEQDAIFDVPQLELPVEPEQQSRIASKQKFWQNVLLIPRVILMVLTFLAVVQLSYGEYADENGLLHAAGQMLAMHDLIDWLVVVCTIALLVWYVPHLILAILLFPFILSRPALIASEQGIVAFSDVNSADINSAEANSAGLNSSASNPARVRTRPGQSEMSAVFHGESALNQTGMVDTAGALWLTWARNRILDRKLYVIVAAAIALAAGLAAYFNSAQFNPNIKPLVAVLRSNFWLTVHVIAIIVSYAAALVAWGMAVLAIGAAAFGTYRREPNPDGKPRVLLPYLCEMFGPNILTLIRLALLLLVLGTILGARWADYSWGRFWGWDPKEVWALITILVFSVILHGRLAGFYGMFGIIVGALYSSIAVIFTWYGINFAFKSSIHSYGGGAHGGATFFLWTFVLLNLIWGGLALFRYMAETTGHEEIPGLDPDEPDPDDQPHPFPFHVKKQKQ